MRNHLVPLALSSQSLSLSLSVSVSVFLSLCLYLSPSISVSVSLCLSFCLSLSLSSSLSLSLCVCLSLSLALPPGNHDKSDLFPCSAFRDSAPTQQCLNSSLKHFKSTSCWGSLEFNSARLLYKPVKTVTTSGQIRGGSWDTVEGHLRGFLTSSPLRGGVEPPPKHCHQAQALWVTAPRGPCSALRG